MMASSDQHSSCIACLGIDHAVESFLEPTSCPACARFERLRLRERINTARRALGGEGTRGLRQVADPNVWSGARRADRPHGHDLPWSGAHGGPDPEFSPPPPPRRDGGGAARPGQAPRRPPLASFTNPEPPADYSDYSQSSQYGSGDVYMTSPRQDPVPDMAPRCRSPIFSVGGDTTRSPARRVVLSQEILSSLSSLSSVPTQAQSDQDYPSPSTEAEDPILDMFKAAAAICDIPWPSTAVPEPQPQDAAEGPDGWLGIPPEPPKAPNERFFPPARGLKTAFQQPWERHVPPPRHVWLRGVDNAEALGLLAMPKIDESLGNALIELLRIQQNRPGAKKSDKGFDLKKDIPFTDKATHDAAKESKSLFDALALAMRDVNALSLLLSAITLKLANQHSGVDYADIDENKALGFCNLLCRHLTGWMGRMYDLLVHQERRRWLAPHVVDHHSSQPSWNMQLLNLPTSPSTLFPGGGELLVKVVDEKKAHNELTKTLAAEAFIKPPAPPAKQQEQRGRSESKGAHQARKPSASPAPRAQDPQAQAQPRSSSAQPIPPLMDQPTRYRSKSRGRWPKQGK